MFCGLLSGAFVWWINPAYRDCVELIKILPQLTTCIFGFLLTLLGLILQGDGPIIKKMKESSTIFNRFINFNKKIVFLSFILTFLTLFAGYAHYEWFHSVLVSVSPVIVVFTKKVVLAIISMGAIWLIIDLIVFLRLFYMLIMGKQ